MKNYLLAELGFLTCISAKGLTYSSKRVSILMHMTTKARVDITETVERAVKHPIIHNIYTAR